MPLPETVSPLEILWTLVTFSGCAIATWNCWDALGDLRLVRREGLNGALIITAAGEWIDQRLILFVLACDFIAGVLAMFALPGREPDGDPSLSSFIVPWLLIGAAVALIVLSSGKKYRRKRITSILRGQQTDVADQRHTELTNSLDALHTEISDNTALTAHAAERADAAYVEANHVNEKIEHSNKAGQIATEAGNRIMGALGITGDDTNVRVRKVETAVTQTEITAEITGHRLDKLEEAADDADAPDP